MFHRADQRLNFKLKLSVALTAAFTPSITACDLCALYSASQARGEVGQGLFLGAAEQFTHFGTLQQDGQRVPNPTGQYLDSSISQVLVGYNLTERAGLQLNVPLIYRSFQRPAGFATDRGSEAGPGDISLLGNWVAYRHLGTQSTFSWSVLGGLKLPSGSTSRLTEELNESGPPGAPLSGIHGHDLTLGSGSVDGVMGTSVYSRYKRLFFMAGTQYAVRSTGDFGYRFANDLTWSGGPGFYALIGHKFTLGFQAAVSGEHKGRDTFRGATAEDTGLTAVYLGPQVSFTWSHKLSAEVGLDLPASLHNTAFQAVPDYRVRVGLVWRF